MKLVTANIKCNPQMRQSYVDADVSKVRDLGGITLWQEISITRYRDALHRLLPKRIHVALGTETPITYKPWLWHVSTDEELPHFNDAPLDLFTKGVVPAGSAVRMHGGKAAVTPPRYVSYVILTRSVKGQLPVVYMNSHMISSAWSNRHPLTKAYRRTQWWVHFNKQKRMVEYFVSKGLTVIGGGDTNRTDMPKFHPDQRFLSHGGIDHLWAVQAKGGAQLKLMDSHPVPGLHTDHAPRVVELEISA